MASAREDDFTDQVYQLSEFVQSFSLPQTVKIIEGYYSEDLEFSSGDVLVLKELECRGVAVDLLGDPNAEPIWLARDFGATFRILPAVSTNHVFTTVKDLVERCPFMVRVNSSYVDPEDDVKLVAGERLKLIRVVRKRDKELLECKKVMESKLMLLPMNCVGNFTELPSERFFTIRELIEILPRSRHLVFSDPHTGRRYPLPRYNKEYLGVLQMQTPKWFIIVHPQTNPGQECKLSLSETPITVSVRDSDYTTITSEFYDIGLFVSQNQDNLPLVCKIIDWQESTPIMDRFEMIPSSEILLHKIEDAQSVLAMCGTDYFVIPMDYGGYFKLVKQTYTQIATLESVRPKGLLRVTKGEVTDVPELDSLHCGDIVKLAENKWCLKQHRPAGSTPDEEVDILMLILHNATTLKAEKLIRVPLYLNAEFEEVVTGPLSRPFTLRSVRLDYPVLAYHTHIDPECEHNSLPIQQKIKLLGQYTYECVLVSVVEEAKVFTELGRIPLTTKINIAYARKEGKQHQQMIMSKANACPFQIDKHTASNALENKVNIYTDVYEEIKISDSLPPRGPQNVSAKTVLPKRPPKPKHLTKTKSEVGTGLPIPALRRIKPSKSESESNYPGARKPNIDQHSDDDVFPDYEETFDHPYEYLLDLGLPMKNVKIPPDGNLYNFTVNEMISFFHQMRVEPAQIIRCKQQKVDGKEFSKMSPHDMEELGLSEHQVLQHFQINTKKPKKFSFLTHII